jgi:NNP family nitrate/nitrite transporter-like MFS transporter
VSVVQFVTPLVVSVAVFGALGGEPQTYKAADATQQLWLQNAGFIWVPFIIVASLAAWFGMNDIADARASFAEQAVIFTRKHNWLMCWLYIGTFGSFIGFSAGLALLTKSQFPGVNPTAYAFLGPLVGALTRPVGGWISDKLGGARVTLWTFIGMILAVFAVLAALPADGGAAASRLPRRVHRAVRPDRHRQRFDVPHDPVIFLTERQRAAGKDAASQRQAVQDAGKESAAVLGFSVRSAPTAASSSPRASALAGPDWFAPCRALLLHRLLRDLCARDLVVLRPPQRRNAVLTERTPQENPTK